MPGYLEIADSQVGYRGNPENVTKYWADLQPSYQGLAWCGAFISWCLWKAGVLTSAMGGPMYYVPAMVDRARSRGQWASNPKVGALTIMDFGSGAPKHVEFCVGITSGGHPIDIGGNTGDDEVARKTRTSGVLGYWHIQAPTGSIPPGSSGDSGPTTYGGMSNMYRVAAPTPNIVGADGESAAVFGGRGRFLNA